MFKHILTVLAYLLIAGTTYIWLVRFEAMPADWDHLIRTVSILMISMHVMKFDGRNALTIIAALASYFTAWWLTSTHGSDSLIWVFTLAAFSLLVIAIARWLPAPRETFEPAER